MTIAPGSRLGPYDILAELGHGGMGVVYTARNPRLDRQVAIKVLPPDLTRDDTAKQRFLQEAKAASALDHPNICTIHEINETDDGQLYLVMAYYDGETLKQRIERGPLALDEAIDIATQVGQGLAEAHRAGIVHRDIKPANLLIAKGGVVKILDFGLAKLAGTEGVTQTGAAVGTVAYMSPEQARGEEVDHRTDIWSLGVVLYEMLAGQPPFRGENLLSLSGAIQQDPPPVLTGDSSSLSGVVVRALDKSRSQRYQAVTDLLGDLRNSTVAAAQATSQPDVPSIAVLPFVNMSPDPDNEYFSDGLSEELLNSLAQLRGLKVAARTSSFAFKNETVDLRDVAKRLGVNTVLEGSVRRHGQRVRITAQLINAADGYQVWSASYERELDDVFGIQTDIARRVADALSVTLLESDAKRLETPDTRSTEAYDAYLQGLQQMAGFRVDSVLQAADSFRHATELDPSFAKAHAGIANAYLLAYMTSAIHVDELIRAGDPAMKRALALDPRLGEAHAARGGILTAQGNTDEAKAAFRRALELNPGNTSASQGYAFLLWNHWELDEMLEVYDEAIGLAPLDPTLHAWRGWGAQTLGRLGDALADFARSRALDENNPVGYYLAGLLYLGTLGDPVEAVTWLSRSVAIDPQDPELLAWLAHAYLALDELALAAREATRALEMSNVNGLVLSTAALTNSCQGKEEAALRLARRCLEPDVVDRFGGRLMSLRILRTTWLRRGNAEEALRGYEAAYATVAQGERFERAPVIHPQAGGFGELVRAAVDLAHLRMQVGDESGARALMTHVTESLAREPRLAFQRLLGPGLALGEVAILEGRQAEGLAIIERVVDTGWVAGWRFEIERNPILDGVRDIPAYRRIVAKLEASTRRHRERMARSESGV